MEKFVSFQKNIFTIIFFEANFSDAYRVMTKIAKAFHLNLHST